MSSSSSDANPPDTRSCTACRGPVARPFFELREGFLCGRCLSRMSVSELQRSIHASEVRGRLHL